MEVMTFNADDNYIGTVTVKFTSYIKYYIYSCARWTYFPVQPPVEMNDIWTIRKTATGLSIEHNGVELLNYRFSDSSDEDCLSRWGGDVVEKIKFNVNDKASDSYKAKPTGNEGVNITAVELP